MGIITLSDNFFQQNLCFNNFSIFFNSMNKEQMIRRALAFCFLSLIIRIVPIIPEYSDLCYFI